VIVRVDGAVTRPIAPNVTAPVVPAVIDRAYVELAALIFARVMLDPAADPVLFVVSKRTKELRVIFAPEIVIGALATFVVIFPVRFVALTAE
jgi:hypothetical protein